MLVAMFSDVQMLQSCWNTPAALPILACTSFSTFPVFDGWRLLVSVVMAFVLSRLIVDQPFLRSHGGSSLCLEILVGVAGQSQIVCKIQDGQHPAPSPLDATACTVNYPFKK